MLCKKKSIDAINNRCRSVMDQGLPTQIQMRLRHTLTYARDFVHGRLSALQMRRVASLLLSV